MFPDETKVPHINNTPRWGVSIIQMTMFFCRFVNRNLCVYAMFKIYLDTAKFGSAVVPYRNFSRILMGAQTWIWYYKYVFLLETKFRVLYEHRVYVLPSLPAMPRNWHRTFIVVVSVYDKTQHHGKEILSYTLWMALVAFTAIPLARVAAKYELV